LSGEFRAPAAFIQWKKLSVPVGQEAKWFSLQAWTFRRRGKKLLP